MRPKSIVLLMLALGCGLIASIGINQVLANRATQQTPTQDTTAIYVVKTQVELGIQVTPEMVQSEPWPTNLVPEGAITSLGDIEGRVTKSRIYPGEPILSNKLFSKGDSTAGPTVLIPDGHRVTPVKVDAVSGGSGLLQPGDRVDVLVYLEKNESKDIPISGTGTLLQDIRVFAVNAQFRRENEEGDGMAMAKTISLLLTPQHVELITLAANMGEIHLVLRSPEDDATVETTGLTAQDVLNMTGSGNRADEDLLDGEGNNAGDDLLSALDADPQDTVATPPAPVATELPNAEPDWTMTLLQDGVASRVTFINGFVHIEPLNQDPNANQAQPGTAADDAKANGDDASEWEENTEAEDTDDFDDFEEFDFDDDDSIG